MEKTQKKRILIVEDEPIIRRMCSRTLAFHGFEVDVAENGIEALEALSRRQYDACLSDITMPGLNGMQLYRKLAAICPEQLERIIFTTGDMLNQEVKDFVKTLKNPFLAKPFSLDELICLINQVIEKHLIKL